MKQILSNYVNELNLPIFPIKLTQNEKGKWDKIPLVKWSKYQQQLPSEEEINHWCNRYTNYGLATGELSRIVVVDVDMANLEEAEMILGETLTSPIMVHTPSGGMHIWYRWSEELRNTVKLEGAPIDFRGDGGYVVIPPSKHKDGAYLFKKPITPTLKMLIPDLPQSIVRLLSMNHSKVRVDLNTPANNDVFRDGQRNAASVVAIRKLLGKMPQELWLSSGWFAFNYWCKTFCQPALDDFQIKATFDWWIRVNVKSNEVVGKKTMQIGIERIEERKLEKTAPTTGYPSLDEKIKGWIPGHLYTFTGETNAGKTAAACNFAYRVAQQGKLSTYFALEPDVGVIEYLAGIHHRKRWDMLTDEDLKIDIQGMTIFTKEDNMNLKKLVKTIEDMPRQDLIIVDHIGYFTDDPTDKRGKTDKESDAIKRIVSAAKAKNTAIMIIAHPRKNTESKKKNAPLSINDIAGSAAFKQDSTDVLIFHMEKDETDIYNLTYTQNGVILIHKAKTGKPGAVQVHFIPDSPIMEEGHFYHTVEGNKEDGQILEF